MLNNFTLKVIRSLKQNLNLNSLKKNIIDILSILIVKKCSKLSIHVSYYRHCICSFILLP